MHRGMKRMGRGIPRRARPPGRSRSTLGAAEQPVDDGALVRALESDEEEEEKKEDGDRRDSSDSASQEPFSLVPETQEGEGSMTGAALPASPPKIPPKREPMPSLGATGSSPDSAGWSYAATPEARALAPLVQLCVLQPLYSVARSGKDADVIQRRDLARRIGGMGLLVLGAFRLEEDSLLARSKRTLDRMLNRSRISQSDLRWLLESAEEHFDGQQRLAELRVENCSVVSGGDVSGSGSRRGWRSVAALQQVEHAGKLWSTPEAASTDVGDYHIPRRWRVRTCDPVAFHDPSHCATWHRAWAKDAEELSSTVHRRLDRARSRWVMRSRSRASRKQPRHGPKCMRACACLRSGEDDVAARGEGRSSAGADTASRSVATSSDFGSGSDDEGEGDDDGVEEEEEEGEVQLKGVAGSSVGDMAMVVGTQLVDGVRGTIDAFTGMLGKSLTGSMAEEEREDWAAAPSDTTQSGDPSRSMSTVAILGGADAVDSGGSRPFSRLPKLRDMFGRAKAFGSVTEAAADVVPGSARAHAAYVLLLKVLLQHAHPAVFRNEASLYDVASACEMPAEGRDGSGERNHRLWTPDTASLLTVVRQVALEFAHRFGIGPVFRHLALAGILGQQVAGVLQDHGVDPDPATHGHLANVAGNMRNLPRHLCGYPPTRAEERIGVVISNTVLRPTLACANDAHLYFPPDESDDVAKNTGAFQELLRCIMGACVVRGVVTHLTAQDSRYAGPTAGSATAAGAGGTSSPASARDSARSSSLPLASFAAETRLRDVDLVTARTGLLSGPSLRTILEASAREMARLLHEALTMRQRYMDLRREAVAFARENVQQTFVEAEERGILQGSGGGNGPAAAPTARQSVATALRAQEMRRSSAAKSSVATASGVATKAPRTPTAAGTAEGDDPPLLRRTSVESALVQPSPGQVDSAGDHGVQVLDLAAFGASLEDDAVQQMGAEEEEVRQQLEATPLLEPGESTLTCTQLWLLTTLTVQAVEEDEGTFGSACRRAVGDSVSYPRLSSRALYEWLVLDLLRYLTTSTPFRGPFDCALFPLHQALSKLLARMRALGADQDVNMLDLDAHFGAHLPVWIEMEHSVITEAYLPSAFAREAWTPVSRTTGTSAMLGTVLTLVRERMHDFHSFPGATDPANRSRFALRLITELFLAYAENTCKSLADELQVRRKDVLSALGSDCSSRGTAKPTAKKEVEAARPGSGGPIPSTPRTEAKGGKDAAAQLPFALEFPMDRYEEALARMAVQVNDLHALVQVLPRFMQELSRSPPHGSTNGGEGAEDKEAEDGVSVGVKGYKVRVHVWGARSVPKMDVLSQSDPYVVLRLAGSEGELEASAAHAAWASSYLRDTSRPVWNEFAGGMAASRWGQVPSPDALLRVELWDQNDVLSDTRIGWLDVRMRQFLDKHTEDPFGDHTKPGPRAHWLTLRHPSHRGPRGEVCIDVRMYSDEAGSWGLRRLKEVENTAAETVVKTWFSRGAIGDLLEAMVLGSPFEPSLVHGSCPCVPGVKVDQLIRGNIGEAGVEEAGSAAPWLKLAEEQAAQRIGPLVSYLEAPVTALYAHMDQEVADKLVLLLWRSVTLKLEQLLLSFGPLSGVARDSDPVGWATGIAGNSSSLLSFFKRSKRPPSMLCGPQIALILHLERLLAVVFNCTGPKQSQTFHNLLLLWAGSASDLALLHGKLTSKSWSPSPLFDSVGPAELRKGVRPEHVIRFLKLRSARKGPYAHLSTMESVAAHEMVKELTQGS